MTKMLKTVLPICSRRGVLCRSSVALVGENVGIGSESLNQRALYSNQVVKLKAGGDEAGGGGPLGMVNRFVSRVWNQYSISAQQNRNVLAERYFRSAQLQANNPVWYGPGRIGRNFRARHAMLTMHVWFLHKRLITAADDKNHQAKDSSNNNDNRHHYLQIQEELFDILWHDTKARIRAQGVNELTVNKHLKDVQQVTFQHLTHYDHAYSEFATDSKKRIEELMGLVWVHLLMMRPIMDTDGTLSSNHHFKNQQQPQQQLGDNNNENDEDELAHQDHLFRLACYIDYQHENIVHRLPDEYFSEGRISWVQLPDFDRIRNIRGKLLSPIKVHDDDVLSPGWHAALTDSGEPYYWNPTLMKSQWEKPNKDK